MKKYIILFLMLVPAVLFSKEADWSGKYNGSKDEGTNAGGTPIFYAYAIHIKKTGRKYSVEYSEDGYQTMTRIQGELIPEKEGSAKIIFLGWGEENSTSYQNYRKGDVIMRIKRKKNGVCEVRYQNDEFKKEPVQFIQEKETFPSKK